MGSDSQKPVRACGDAEPPSVRAACMVSRCLDIVGEAIGSELVGQEMSGQCDMPEKESNRLLAIAALTALSEGITGPMWTAGRREFAGLALQFEQASRTEMRMAFEDRAPEVIFGAMIGAALKEASLRVDATPPSDTQDGSKKDAGQAQRSEPILPDLKPRLERAKELLRPADLKWLMRHLTREKYTGHCGEENAEIRARHDYNERCDRLIQAAAFLSEEGE